MRISVLAVPDLFDSGLSAVLDVLATANALRAEVAASVPPFEVTVAGTGASLRTGQGLCLATAPLAELDIVPDLLVMPAVACGFTAPQQVVDIVRNHPALAHLARLYTAGSALAAACTGTFFLAEAGVLDGLLATTSWWLGPAFRRRYPAVRLDDSRTLARDGRVTTAGAAFAHIDLALSIVAQESPALAELAARYLVIGDRPSQAVFAVPAHLAGTDLDWARSFPRPLAEIGLERIGLAADLPVIGPGTPMNRFFTASVQRIADPLLAFGRVTAAEFAQWTAELSSGQFWDLGLANVAAWGYRPQSARTR